MQRGTVMGVRPAVVCPDCGREVRVKGNGLFYAHRRRDVVKVLSGGDDASALRVIGTAISSKRCDGGGKKAP